jgi:REP-associated tyrosine transposase
MPRLARVVLPGSPHHVTQRGNHREPIFFAAGDQAAYLSLLNAYSRQEGVKVMAYCLMPNHVHLVLVPGAAHGLHRALMATHGQYAQRINRMRGQSGHLWQGRYFSSPLDENHFLHAIRYVELNPVRAGLVVKAQDYEWSSARAHCGTRFNPILESTSRWAQLAAITSWSRWLAEGIADDTVQALRLNARRNLPCGSRDFIARLERFAGRELQYRPAGGQRKGYSGRIRKNEGDCPLRSTS